MPYYDLVCEDCRETCTIRATVRERSEGQLACPACGSKKMAAVFKKVNVLRFHNKDCDVCPGSGRTGPSAPHSCCGGACAHSH